MAGDPECRIGNEAEGIRAAGDWCGRRSVGRDRGGRPLDEYLTGRFDLIVLATKAHDTIEVASKLSGLLEPDGTLLPIQNGGVPQMLGDRLGECVLGGLSNLGATMTEPGTYEQRNAGHLLIGELDGGESERAERVRQWLGRALDIRVTPNLRGAVWSKLLLNCSVTTLGAVAGGTMRGYITSSEGREVFEQAYDEALPVALASGARPERMIRFRPPDLGAASRSRSTMPDLIRYSKATVMSDPQCCRISSAGALPRSLHQRIRRKHRSGNSAFTLP